MQKEGKTGYIHMGWFPGPKSGERVKYRSVKCIYMCDSGRVDNEGKGKYEKCRRRCPVASDMSGEAVGCVSR